MDIIELLISLYLPGPLRLRVGRSTIARDPVVLSTKLFALLLSLQHEALELPLGASYRGRSTGCQALRTTP